MNMTETVAGEQSLHGLIMWNRPNLKETAGVMPKKLHIAAQANVATGSALAPFHLKKADFLNLQLCYYQLLDFQDSSTFCYCQKVRRNLLYKTGQFQFNNNTQSSPKKNQWKQQQAVQS